MKYTCKPLEKMSAILSTFGEKQDISGGGDGDFLVGNSNRMHA